MQEISDKMGDNQFAKVTAICMDCEEEFVLSLERKSDTELEIKNGAVARRKDTYFCKCQECFDADKSFGQDIEVYSRVVGYLRPVRNWNQAKKQEFGMRKNYALI